ncbi:MAG: glycosyl hydrolase family 3 [Agathobacter sp.]|nr:glycosyl hydrolase family 3 [Agathobacter sp.]
MSYLTGKPFYLTEEQEKWVHETKSALTLEQKAGQLFCVMGGDYAPDELRELVKNSRVGGILFRPIVPAEEIRSYYKPLDEVSPIPLLKAANLEEGGSGGISDGTLFGWPMTVAAADDLTVTENFGKVCAIEGQSVGINWTFSPVCDIDMNYLNPITNVRTFGSDVDKVLKNTETYVKTVQSLGVAACAKHYPGDGVDYRDQHLHPTYNSLSAEDWYSSYGKVYQNLINNGLMSIMVGHICQPAVSMDINPELKVENCLPASLSKELLTGVLRKKFGFQGLITTDATIMGGFTMAMERKKAIPTAIMAGCDMIVFNTNLAEDYQYILDGIRDGLLTEERLDEAVEKILALKAKVCVENKLPEIDGAALHRDCVDKAITLVKNNAPQVLPISTDKYPTIRLVTLGKDDILDGSVRAIAKEVLEDKGFRVEVYQPYADDLHGTKDLDKKRLTLFFANYEQASNQTVVRIDWCKKHALDMPRFIYEEDSVFVSLASPYNLQDVPRVRTYINAYTATRASIEACVEKLMGLSEFKGVSPVDPFCGLSDTRL